MLKLFAGASRPGTGHTFWPLPRLWAVHRQPGFLWLPHVLLCVGPSHLCGHGGCRGSHGGALHQSQCQDHAAEAPVHTCQVSSFGSMTGLCCCCLCSTCLQDMSAFNACTCSVTILVLAAEGPENENPAGTFDIATILSVSQLCQLCLVIDIYCINTFNFSSSGCTRRALVCTCTYLIITVSATSVVAAVSEPAGLSSWLQVPNTAHI